MSDSAIQRVADSPAGAVYVRGNCIAVVGATQSSTGLMTDRGLAYLVWRDGEALLSGKGFEEPAAPKQVEEIRRFTADLKATLNP